MISNKIMVYIHSYNSISKHKPDLLSRLPAAVALLFTNLAADDQMWSFFDVPGQQFLGAE